MVTYEKIDDVENKQLKTEALSKTSRWCTRNGSGNGISDDKRLWKRFCQIAPMECPYRPSASAQRDAETMLTWLL